MKPLFCLFFALILNLNCAKLSCNPTLNPDSTSFFRNPGIGCFVWANFDKQPDYLTPFLQGLYIRLSWVDVFKDGHINFDAFTPIFKEAYKFKQRVDIGAFFNLSMTKDPRYRLDDETYHGKDVYICYPKELHRKLMASMKYKPRLIYVNTSDTYWYCIDWRNPIAKKEYKNLLIAFNDFLNEPWNGKTRRMYVNSIQIRFWGFWGEGHNNFLVKQGKNDPTLLEDSRTMIKMDKMYEKIFPDIQLIAPGMGKESFIPDKWKDWALYEMSGKNPYGNYGLFIDHLNNDPHSTDFKLTYKNLSFENMAFSKWKNAPVTGEGYILNYFDFKKNRLEPIDPTLNIEDYDVEKYHINSFNLIRNDRSSQNQEQKLFHAIAQRVGYKLYIVSENLKNKKSNAISFYIGNMGNNPIYSNYWIVELIERDPHGNLVSIKTLNLNLRSLKVSDEYLNFDISKCYHLSIKKKVPNHLYFLRIRDKLGISPNMYLYNVQRTNNGEYPLN